MFKKLIVSTLVAIALTNAEAAKFTLVKNNIPKAVFVIPKGKHEKFNKAIAFFNDNLVRCTKTMLPLVEKRGKNKNNIIFKLEKRPLATEDEFTIDFPTSSTMRITCTETSVRWALNHILEQDIGIRWLFPAPIKKFYGTEINHYPKLKNIAVPIKIVSQKPAVPLSRQCDWQINDFATAWNAKYSMLGVHMMCIDVFPVYKYAVAGSWPTAIMPTVKGKKMVLRKAKAPLSKNIYIAARGYNSHWQPCWSNPETTKIAVANILERLAENPNIVAISMAVNDCGGYCTCVKCRKATGSKRTQTGHVDYSEIYWKWVDSVARKVTKKYPNVIFKGIAYREVLTPPSFKLHPNVLPRLCIELPVMLDPRVAPKRIKLIEDWCAKASQLNLYDYMHGIDFFLIPRIYFKAHSKILKKMITNYKCRAAYFESQGQVPFQGPQQYIFAKILWNVNVDVEALIMDWCEHAVGKKSAKYLRDYYKFWEDYWTGDDIKKTQWYQTVKNVYMQLGEKSTHTYALKKGDMQTLRSLMEKVIANTETPQQKKRADVLMKLFEFSESAVKASFSEIFPPDGRIKTTAEAVELLKAVPEAMHAIKRIEANPYLKFHKGTAKSLKVASISSIGKIMPFIQDKAVRDEINTLLQNKSLPFELRAQFNIWLGAKVKNLIENGSAEFEAPLPPVFWNSGNIQRVTRYASNGKYSFRTHNGYYLFRPKVEPGKTYLFLMDLYIPKGSGEGKFSYKLGAAIGNKPVNWAKFMNNKPTGGMWHTYSGVVTIPTKKSKSTGKYVDNLRVQLAFRKFEKGEFLFIDNIRLYCLDELK